MNVTVIPDPVNEKVSAPRDALGRPMRDLRISLLDRCNFRCPYCMPESEFNADYQFLRKPQLLTHAEILRIAKVAVSLGVTKLRLTGGEPLLDRVDLLIDLLEIGDFADRRAKGFSQGQRIKVALARAMVHDPRNVVLDEPTNGLDVMATRALRELIRRLKAEGRCVLFSSHVMQEVSALCDDIIIIAQGRVVAQGSPAALRAQAGEDDLEEVFVRAIMRAERVE